MSKFFSLFTKHASFILHYINASFSSHFIIVISLFLLTFECKANEEKGPLKIGNFALPASQQPGPLISFGENIIPRNESQLFLFANDISGINKHFVDLIPSILYGVTDNFSLFVNLPFAASYKVNKNHSNGFEDVFVQLEYAFYNKKTQKFIDQATLVGNVTFPSGSSSKIPATGLGSPSFFIGTTYNRTYVDWFFFGSPGAVFTTSHYGTQFGKSYFYQLGFGRNIANVDGWLFAWMLEGDGTYMQRNKINGVIDPNSGSNVIFITPSLWASTKKLVFQFGVGLPIIQHLNGNQKNNTYMLAANLGWLI